MSEPSRPIATPSQTVGPFFHFGLATNPALGTVAGADEPGERIQLRVHVLDGAGQPVPDALIEIYQADAAGRYTQRRPGEGGFTGFGRLPTDADGICTFQTVRPGAVRTDAGDQAAHLNVCFLSRGLLRQVYTRIYFDGDAGLTADPLLSVVPEERRSTLLARPLADEAGTWLFVIRLQGENETVFFDL